MHSHLLGRFTSSMIVHASWIAASIVLVSVLVMALYLPWCIRQAYRQTFIALARAVEAREPHLLGHAEKTARWVVLMARWRCLSPAATLRLEYAALLHGIGKVSVPYGLLNTPACLTSPADCFVLRDYVRVGGAILDAAIPQLGPVADFVRYHHEYADGSGYPYGRYGRGIPFESQMICVASEFVAMTTPRFYRAALSMPPEKAVEYLKAQVGRRYDRQAVRLFLKAKAGEERRLKFVLLARRYASARSLIAPQGRAA